MQTKAPQKVAPKFRFVDTNELKANLGLSEKDVIALRQKLAPPIYWVQPERKVFYNLALWKHYLLLVIHGDDSDRKSHDRLIEEYSASLPSPK